MLNKKVKIPVYCILAAVTILIMLTIVVSAVVTNAGTLEAPYEIRTAEDLFDFAAQVNGGNTDICGKLMNDIDLNPGYTFTFQPDTGLVEVEKAGDGIKGYYGTAIQGTLGGNTVFDVKPSMSGYYYESDDSDRLAFSQLPLTQWTPIGTGDKQYTGTFDGNGKTVSGLFSNNPKKDYVGLFGSVGSGGTVEKVTVTNSYICGHFYVGGICADNIGGTIINCSSSATVSGYMYVGGICGNLSGGAVTSCYNIGIITASQYVGSMLGNKSDGTVTNCYYLTGSAKDTTSAPQFGIGSMHGGNDSPDISGSTAGKTAAEFADGSITVELNRGTNPHYWYQNNGVPTLIPYTPPKLNDNGTPSDTYDDYFEIRTLEDLLGFAAQVNNGNSNINSKLMNDINLNPDYTFTFEPDTGLVKVEKAGDATVYLGTGIKGESGGIEAFDTVASLKGSFYSSNNASDTTAEPTDLVQWTPISEKVDYSYDGTFDGCGHVIKNLYINNPEADGQGLFGHPDRSTIQNLGLLDCAIIGNDNVGGIVGITYYANVDTCFVTGVVVGNEKVGGIYGSFDNNSATKVISVARVSGTSNVGVIAGSLGSDVHFSDSIGLKDNSIPLFGSGTNQGTNVIELSDLSTGEACLIMNGNSSLNPKWFQNIGEGGDEFPVLDSTHGVIYITNNGYASCNEHIKNGSGFCGRCGCYLSDGFEPNEAGAFEIDNAKKLLWFSYYVEYNNAAANAILTSDIDLSTVCGDGIGSFKPIGNNSASYKGKFDGNNHTISNLYFNDSSSSFHALFGNTEKSAVITDLTIENADITCSSSASILVGSNSGLISHCSVGGSITVTDNNDSVGGVCAINTFGTITDCHTKVTVIVNGDNNNVGGVCGRSNSYNYGTPLISTVTGCMNTGSVTVNGDNNKSGPVIGNDSNTTISVVTDNYYLGDSEKDSLEGTIFKTEEQFLSGEVAYLLNKGVTDGTQLWYQTCDAGIPAFSGETVYSYSNCKGEPEYTNDASLSGLVNQHNYENGICTINGEFVPAVLNNGVYEIGNAGQLMWFSALVNGNIVLEGGFSVQNREAKACLTDDITLDNRYIPIGAGDTEYIGIFDGQGHTVTFAVTDTTITDNYGLFGRTTTNASISNLKLAGSISSTNGWGKVGALAAQTYATPITNVISTVNIENKNREGMTGGLVGYFGGREPAVMKNCGVSADASGGKFVGGIIGAGWEGTQFYTIRNCFYIGDLKCTNEAASVGAVVGCSMTNHSNYYGKVNIQNVYYNTVSSAISAVGSWKLAAAEAAAQISKVESVTASQFADGKVAWLLNTAGINFGEGGYTHTGVWSQGAEYPIFADADNKAIYKVRFTGATAKTFYLKSGDTFTLPENIFGTAITSPFTVTEDVIYTAEIAINSANPKLGSSITMIYNAGILTSLVGDNVPQMIFTFNGKTYTVDGVAGTPDGDYTPYTFALTEITPQYMGETIDASLTLDGKTVTKTGYSLKIYCDNILAKSDAELAVQLPETATAAELKTLLSDILLYGAASQLYTEYKTEELVGDIDKLTFEKLTTTDKFISGTKNDNAYFTAAGLWFENINKIYWKIAVSDENLDNLTVNVYRDGETTPCTTTSLTKISDGVYIIYSEDITAKNFATKYRAVITYNNAEAQTVTYSVNSYVYSKQDEETTIGTLVKTLFNYGKSTVAYTVE